MAIVTEWQEPPPMDTGAPMPGVHCDSGSLLLAYISRSGPATELEEFSLVEFTGVLQHTFGYPNDEALGGHPVYKFGLKFYAFNVIEDSPYVAELGKRNATIFPGTESHYRSFIHWIVAFHDETLEVIGRSAQLVGRVEARSAQAAIRWHIEKESRT